MFGADKILNFTINGENFSFDTTVATLEDVVNEINARDIGVIAYYDNSNGRMSISTENTGSNYSIQITADEDNFLTGTDGSGNPTNLLKLNFELNTEYKGQDSVVLYGDDKVAFTSSDNTVSINGVDMTLLSTGTTTITVSTNTDEIYNKIETFVNKYNELIDKINKKLDEEYYRDYKPLTAEQKEALSDKEIELWEKRARSGLLKDDYILKNMLASMRESLYEPVYDDYENGTKSKIAYLFDIGITTKSYSEKGKLQIDETKLKQAIENDPEGVLNFFFKTPSDDVIKDDDKLTSDEIKEKDAESGLINRLFNDAIRGMEEVIKKAGLGEERDLLKSVKSNITIEFVTKYGSISRLQKDISSLSKRISDNQIKTNKYEDRLWKQFTALEKALAEMNSNSSYFMSMGGM